MADDSDALPARLERADALRGRLERADALRGRLERALPEEARQVLRQAIELAVRGGTELFLVGGAVRDLLLGASHIDVDLVVEGNAIELAGALSASETRTRIVRHERFGTASVVGPSYRFDFAGARTETYARPGALPQVRPGLLDADLARRDFSINAMALPLTGMAAGRLIDPHGGKRDLKARFIRALHDDSFRDDGTRVLRAVRYAGRLGFTIEPKTRRLLKAGLPYLRPISGTRLRREFERIAEEQATAAIVRQAERLGVLRAVHPALHADATAARAAGKLATMADRDALIFCLLLGRAPPRVASAAATRLSLTKRQADAVRGLLALRRSERQLGVSTLRPSAVVRLLASAPDASIEAFALRTTSSLAARRARSYLDVWRHVEPCLNGRDIEALGVAPGPDIGRAVAALRAARLDGAVTNRDDEQALVKKMARRSSRRRAHE